MKLNKPGYNPLFITPVSSVATLTTCRTSLVIPSPARDQTRLGYECDALLHFTLVQTVLGNLLVDEDISEKTKMYSLWVSLTHS